VRELQSVSTDLRALPKAVARAVPQGPAPVRQRKVVSISCFLSSKSYAVNYADTRGSGETANFPLPAMRKFGTIRMFSSGVLCLRAKRGQPECLEIQEKGENDDDKNRESVTGGGGRIFARLQRF
jgi:hypothetical protein